MASRKTPKVREAASREKKPKSESLPNIGSHYPSWQISLLQMVDPWGWHQLDAEKTKEIRDKLVDYEQKTWNTILITEKYRNHPIQVSDLCPEAQRKLIDMRQDDVDEVISFRLSARERIFGIRIEAVMRLLWWDPEHQVCPSILRNT